VTTHRPIAVSEWSESKDTVIPPKGSSWRVWPPSVIGLVGTLLLHGIALQTAILQGRSQRIPPPEVRELQSSPSKAAPGESLVFIELPHPAKTDGEIDKSLALARETMAANLITVKVADLSPVLDALPLSEDATASSVDSGDGAEHARLLGIYSGQIRARVERVWSRPRTPVSDGGSSSKAPDTVGYFHCQAQIAQNSAGVVQEILLPHCNGSVAWQHSLVVAIQQASPLPAPPSPTVFSRTVTLNFVGYPYVSGGSDQGYELATEMAKVTAPTKVPEEVSREFSSYRADPTNRAQ
jgi:hypothetical protein